MYVYHCLPLLGNCTFIHFGEFNPPQLVLRDDLCDDNILDREHKICYSACFLEWLLCMKAKGVKSRSKFKK